MRQIELLAKSEVEMEFLTNYGLNEFLKVDEIEIYNRIMEKMNDTWQDSDTDLYVQLSMKHWQQ